MCSWYSCSPLLHAAYQILKFKVLAASIPSYILCVQYQDELLIGGRFSKLRTLLLICERWEVIKSDQVGASASRFIHHILL